MSLPVVSNYPGPYGLSPDIHEPLLAGLCLLLMALGLYLVLPGVSRCYHLVRTRAGAGGRAGRRPQRAPVRSPARSPAPLNLLSAPDQTRPLLSRLARQCKLRARALLYPRQTRRWLAFWNKTSTHAALALATPRLLHKIYRPYQSLRLRQPQRLDILTSHYDFIIGHSLAPLVLQASRRPIPLGRFQGKSGQDYEVRLAAISSLDHEGELALHLYCGQEHLFSTAFTLCRQGAGWIVRIGCLQGAGSANSREQIRRATRDLFGLRPKALMVRLVRAIGAGFGCARVVLVSNGNRVSNRRSKKGRVHADYDAFWQELGAARRSDGDYELPCEEAAPNLQDLPSRKRAEGRQRQALTQAVTQQVRGALAHAGA
ncbi:VirK/YbjX family protein [Herbaspirillum sp. DW155]|uniref:VirK/YbjX family protein n=1 Tax=Herbaspirillum sp. DW155 TaxID=3095609 RepID=UPI003090E9C6|nr:VirK/YbjX family protein [Herbaspirillum sp. DW155]